MGHILLNPKVLVVGLVVAVMAVAVGAFFVTINRATAERGDWPPLTMRYSETVSTNDQTINKTYLFTYNSYTDWKEEVISADSIETELGTFSSVGSYRQLRGREYSEYHSTTGSTDTETIDEDITMIPRGALMPMAISVVEDAYDQRAESVTTEARGCFQGECTENAPGWKLVLEGQTIIFADDARGMPIQVGDFFVEEIMVGAPTEEFTPR